MACKALIIITLIVIRYQLIVGMGLGRGSEVPIEFQCRGTLLPATVKNFACGVQYYTQMRRLAPPQSAVKADNDWQISIVIKLTTTDNLPTGQAGD